MANDCWVVATDPRRLAAMTAAARGLGGHVTVVAIGERSLAEAAAGAGADAVAWAETPAGTPAEAYAPALARAVAEAAPRATLAAATSEGRALLGWIGAALGASVISGVSSMQADGEAVLVERVGLGGRVIESFAVGSPLAALFDGEDTPPPADARAPVEHLPLEPIEIRLERTVPVPGATGGVSTADRVVAIGRGLKAKDDLAIVESLAAALGAEVACSMPIADDFGWVAKERYVGRSGQQIAPRLYVAVGISGMPQHLEGVRDARVVVGINTDPGARIFKRADYGIVGDLYEVVPALQQALGK
jgi:electron transfer flavoprotein alpha subunit